ncbi:hypothetical protein G6F68_008672 [Rhizopus microsporus]|nr:hypothetical protein G6F68_008672 [Rhizopus microsporus]
MSDSSENSQRNDRHSSENTHINERHTHQRNNFPEDILRSNHEDLSQLEDQWGAKQTRDSEVFTHNNLSEFDEASRSGSEDTIKESRGQGMTISSFKRASNPSNSTNSEQTRHNSSNYNVRNGQNSRFNEDDPMEEGSRSTVLSFQGNRSHSFISDASLADSEASLTKDFGNLFNSSFANNFNHERTFEKVSQPKRNESGPLLKRKRNALKGKERNTDAEGDNEENSRNNNSGSDSDYTNSAQEVRGRGRPKLSAKEKEKRIREENGRQKNPRGRPRKATEPVRKGKGAMDSFIINLTKKDS